MPIFEYTCQSCQHRFEVLVRAAETTPACPACDGTSVAREQSTFAARTASPAMAAPPMGGCGQCGDPRGPGSCSMN